MSRLTIDLTDEQHKALKAIAALEGKTIKQYSIEKLFRGKSEAELADENQAWEEFKLFIGKRVDEAEKQGYISKSITEIFDEVWAEDESA